MEFETKTIIKQNWLTKVKNQGASELTAVLVGLIFLGSLVYMQNLFGAESWMPATGEMVFQRGQYWRAWTTLFAHGDVGHALGNAFLFVPFSLFLSRHFSFWVFPGLAFLMGGLTNLVVLQTMPAQIALIGASGVVYWMGAAWLTFFLLIERRDKPARRLGKVILAGVVLFIPETFHENVSYLAHLVGFLFGVAAASGSYLWLRQEIAASEVRETLIFPVIDLEALNAPHAGENVS